MSNDINQPPEIITGSIVTMHFSLSLTDGSEAISTFGEEPAHFQMGDGTLMPTLEMVIFGLKQGDKHERILNELESFGPRDSKLVSELPLSDFPDDLQPEPGQIISFSADDGAEAPGEIQSVEDGIVTVDFNHPLAGRDVIFKVEILEVQNGGGNVKILLANPRGFCAGVDRAIEIVEKALDLLKPPIYVRHEVVHNRFVVNGLKQRGAVFVDELDDVPDNGTVIFSAHGVAKEVQEEAKRRGLQVFDATCPLVTKVHMEVARHCKQGDTVILIGHRGHPEVEGTMGQYLCNNDDNKVGSMLLVETAEDVAQLQVKDPDKLAYVTQTTLSMDDTKTVIEALKERFPNINGPKKDDICYATQNRQNAVRKLASSCDLVLVVGSPNSSNSNRLRELAEKEGVNAYLIDGPEDIREEWLNGVESVGITAGASAPEVLVDNVIAHLGTLTQTVVETIDGMREDVTFVLPKNMRQLIEQA